MKKIENFGLTFDDVLIVPKYSNIKSRLSEEISLKTNITNKILMDKPIIASPMNCVCDYKFAIEMRNNGCVGVIHRFQPVEEQMPEDNMCNVPCAVGINEDDRFDYLYKRNTRIFLIDVANGHTGYVEDEIKKYKDKYEDIEIIAGNIVTAEAADYLINSGADCLRVGIGAGSCCSTRVATGCGVPNLTAIKLVSEGCDGRIPIIADGGIRNSGDIVKSLAWGADVVMLGRMLAGFSKCGTIMKQNGQCYKIYLGQASRKFQEQNGKLKKGTAPEGTDTFIPMRYDLTLEEFIDELTGGIRSAMTYLNCRSISELRNCDYIEVSQNSAIESLPKS